MLSRLGDDRRGDPELPFDPRLEVLPDVLVELPAGAAEAQVMVLYIEMAVVGEPCELHRVHHRQREGIFPVFNEERGRDRRGADAVAPLALVPGDREKIVAGPVPGP